MYLRRQDTLVTEMGVKSPKKTNRWVALGGVLKFDIKYEPRIVEYMEARRHHRGSAAPPVLSETWWVLTYALSPGIERVNETFVALQPRLLLICQQRTIIDLLVTDLIEMYDVRRVNDEEPVVGDGYRLDNWFVPHSSLVTFIHNQGSRATNHYDALDANEKLHVRNEVGAFAVGMVDGMRDIVAERTSRNEAAEEEAPPCMPHDLVVVASGMFVTNILGPRRAHLTAANCTDADLWTIEEEHRELVKAYRNPQFAAIVDKFDHTTDFNHAWDQVGARFTNLRSFCAGLAVVFPNQACVEADFSILKWEKDEFRQNLLDLSLEGIFQTKQFSTLTAI